MKNKVWDKIPDRGTNEWMEFVMQAGDMKRDNPDFTEKDIAERMFGQEIEAMETVT